jgi:hypothetical protein
MKKDRTLSKSTNAPQNQNNPLQSFKKDDMNNCENILKKLISDKRSIEFRRPVDYVTLGLHDYPLLIKKPMDLSTLKNNLKNGKYSTLQEFFADLQLIWDNCKNYNRDDSVSIRVLNYTYRISIKMPNT